MYIDMNCLVASVDVYVSEHIESNTKATWTGSGVVGWVSRIASFAVAFRMSLIGVIKVLANWSWFVEHRTASLCCLPQLFHFGA